LQQEMRKALAAKDKEHAVECEKLRQELRQAKETYEGDLKKLRDTLAELEGRTASANSAASKEMERLKAEMRQKLEEADMKSVKMVQDLSKEHQQKLSEVYERQAADLSDLREKLSKSHQERVDEMRRKREVELKELKEAHAQEMQAAKQKYEGQMAEAAAKHKAAVEELHSTAQSVANKHAAEVKQFEIKLKELQDQLTKEQSSHQQTKVNLKGSQDALDAAHEKIKLMERSHEEALRKKDDDYAREKRNLKEQHKTSMEQMLETQLRETTELKEQFDRARQLQDMQIEMLQKRLDELQELYDSRPSREEDVQRISLLETDLAEKLAIVKKLTDEMQFYKLELVNREQNYNKVFGAAPTVGVMNPVTQKKTSSSSDPPKMRLVQQPGAAMQMGLPPLGCGPGPPGAASKKLPAAGHVR